MNRMLRRLAWPALLLTSALVVTACGAGGFGHAATDQPRPPIRSYVALGDAFVAAPYVGKTDQAGGCLRSQEGYPAQVASRLGVTATDVSCTTADTRALLNGAKAPNGKGTLPAQLDAVTSQTDLVTITVGVTDQNLLQRGFYVCMTWPCDQYRIPAQQLGTEVAAVGDAVTQIVRAVLQRAPNAFVVIVGYPNIAPPHHGCKGLPTMSADQLLGVNAMFIQLNHQLRDSAAETGTTFADLTTTTGGHDVCSAHPWVRSPLDKRGAKFALLPLAPEPKAAADAVMTAVQNR